MMQLKSVSVLPALPVMTTWRLVPDFQGDVLRSEAFERLVQVVHGERLTGFPCVVIGPGEGGLPVISRCRMRLDYFLAKRLRVRDGITRCA